MPSNEYYDSTGYPSTGAIGSSASMRSELDLIEAGFIKLPALSGNANELVKVNSGASGMDTVSAADLKILLSLNNVDNTADMDKPISDDVQDALDALELDLENQIANIDLSTVAFNDIIGGDITKTAATTLSVSPCKCWDSEREVLLETTITKTITAPTGSSWAANTIYHIYQVRVITGAIIEFRAYATASAVESDAEINAYRWRGFWRTNAAAELCEAVLIGNLIKFGKASENIITGSLITSYAEYDHAAIMPINKILSVFYGATGTGGWVQSTIDGTNTESYIGLAYGSGQADTDYSAWGTNQTGVDELPFLTTRKFKSDNAGTDLLCRAVRIRA